MPFGNRPVSEIIGPIPITRYTKNLVFFATQELVVARAGRDSLLAECLQREYQISGIGTLCLFRVR